MPAPASRRPKQARQKPITAQATESFDEDEEFSGDPKELQALFQQGLLKRVMALIKEGNDTQAPGGSPETAIPAQRVPNSGITQQQVQPPQALPPPTRGERFVAAASPAAGQLISQARGSQFNSQQSAFQEAMRGQRQDKNLAAGLSGSGAANFRPLADTFIDDAGNIFRVTQEVPRSGGFGEPQIIPLFQSDPSKPFTAADIVGQPRPVSQSLRFEEGPRGTLGLNPGTGAAGGISATGGVQGGAQPGTTSNQAGPSNANAAPVVAPVATTGESKDVTQAATLPSFLDATEAMFRDLVTPGSESFASEGERIGVSIGRTLPGIGGKVEELIISRTSPDTVRVARNIDNVSDILLRLRSGAQINEQELKRLSKLLPKIGEGVESALNKFKDFRRELMTILRVKAQLQPGLFTDEILLDTIGMTQEQLFGGGSIVPQPTAEPSTGQPSVLERARALAERNRQEKQ